LPSLHLHPLELGDALQLFEQLGGGLVAVFRPLGEHLEDDGFAINHFGRCPSFIVFAWFG
jgi:hypothetical protein